VSVAPFERALMAYCSDIVNLQALYGADRSAGPIAALTKAKTDLAEVAVKMERLSVSSTKCQAYSAPSAERPHCAERLMPSAPQPSPLGPFSDNKVASRDSQMTLRASGKPCSSPMVSRPVLAHLGGMKIIKVAPLRG